MHISLAKILQHLFLPGSCQEFIAKASDFFFILVEAISDVWKAAVAQCNPQCDCSHSLGCLL